MAFAPLCITLLSPRVCVCACVCKHTVVATVTRFPSLRRYLRDYAPCNDRIEAKETVLVTETVYGEIRAEAEETVESRAHDINGTCALVGEINV